MQRALLRSISLCITWCTRTRVTGNAPTPFPPIILLLKVDIVVEDGFARICPKS